MQVFFNCLNGRRLSREVSLGCQVGEVKIRREGRRMLSITHRLRNQP